MKIIKSDFNMFLFVFFSDYIPKGWIFEVTMQNS